jgi:hypothetical protein
MERSKALKSRIDCAENYFKYKLKDEMETYANFVKGKQYKGTPDKDEVTFNIVHSTCQAVLDAILQNDPHIYIEPEDASAIEPAPLLERVLNREIPKFKVRRQVKLTTLDYVWFGMGITYCGYDYEVKNNEIVKDQPSILHTPLKEFYIDPETRIEDINSAEYMIRKIIKPTKKLKEDERYRHRKQFKADHVLDEDITKNLLSKDDIGRTTLYEIWSLDDGCAYAMTRDSDYIHREIPNLFGDSYPFLLMRNYEMPDELYPFGDIKILYEPQIILNRIFSLLIAHAKSAETIYVRNPDILPDEEARKLKNAKDREVLSVTSGADPTKALVPVENANLSPDVMNAFKIISDVITKLSRQSEYRQSSMPTEQRKATEAMLVEQGSEMSSNTKREDIEELYEEIARKIFVMIRAKYDNTRSILYKEDGKWITANYNKDAFPGEYSFRIEAGSTGPTNSYVRQQNAIAKLNVIKDLAATNKQVAAMINWQELLKSTLTDFDVKNTDQIIMAAPMQVPPATGGTIGEPPGVQPDLSQLDPNVIRYLQEQGINLGGGY